MSLSGALRASAAATAAAASLVWAQAEQQAPSCPRYLKEPWTRQPFKTVRKGDADSRLFLAGTSVRCMMGWCSMPLARAYAFALYVDTDALKSLAGADGAATDALLAAKAGNPAAGDVVVVLKMSRDIDGEHLAHGFFNSVRARAAPSRDVTAQSRAFADQFNTMKLARGDEVAFTWCRDGTVTTRVQGADAAQPFVVTDPAVAAAIFWVYAGPGAVSEEGLATFTANLPAMQSAAAAGQDIVAPVAARHNGER